jgi:RPA family protein
MTNLKKLFLIGLLFITTFLFFSKAQMTFDRTKWLEKDTTGFLYRNLMLPDLITNQKLKGLKKNDLFELLGKPENWRENDSQVFYPIIQKYDEPIHIKWFAIRLTSEQVVEDFKIFDNREK